MTRDTLRHPSIRPAHPGELLREIVLPATKLPKAEIARLLGISRQQLYDILAERKPVTPETAVRLGKLFGDGPGPGGGCRLNSTSGRRLGRSTSP